MEFHVAITVSYGLETTRTTFIANGFQDARQFGSTVIGLRDGGFAIAYGNDFGGAQTPHVSFYRADGTAVQGPLGTYFLPYSGSAAGVQMDGTPDLAQLEDGNVIVTWGAPGIFGNQWIESISAILNPATGQTIVGQFSGQNAVNVASFDTLGLSSGNRVIAIVNRFDSGIDIVMRDERGENLGVYGFGNFASFENYRSVAVAALDNNQFVVCAVRNGGPGALTYEIRNGNGTRDGGTAHVGLADSSQIVGSPVIAGLPQGGFAIAYADTSRPTAGISLMIVNTSSTNPTPIGPIRVDTDLAAVESEPAITVLSNGFIVVSWTQNSGPDDTDIFARIFDQSGRPISINGSRAAFEIGAGDTAAWDSSLAAIGNGQFVITRTDTDPDTNGDSIRGEIQGIVRRSNGDDEANEILGNALRDIMHGNDGNDTLIGGRGGDRIFGGSGNDILDGGDDSDALSGGLGSDTYVVDSQGDFITEVADAGLYDRVTATVSYTLAANDHIEILSTTDISGRDAVSLRGNGFAQTIIGNSGNNVLNDGTGSGIDTLRGGAGDDTYIVHNRRADIVETAGGGGLDRVFTSTSFILSAAAHIEVLAIKSSSLAEDINLRGNALAQRITGNAGRNILDDGGVGGADTLAGGAGSDTYIIRNTGTVIVEGRDAGARDQILTSVSFALSGDDRIEFLSTSSPSGTRAINLTGERARAGDHRERRGERAVRWRGCLGGYADRARGQ
jgi:hypothetical protein